MANKTSFDTDVVSFTGSSNTTHASKLIKIPGRRGKFTELRVYMPTGNTGITVDVAYADDSSVDLTNFATLDPMAVTMFTTGISYAGATTPPGPKANPIVADAAVLFGDNATFDALNRDDHRIAIRITGVTTSYEVRVKMLGEIWR